MESIHSFPPITSPESKVLILGSMPSVTSLEKREYYGHSTNAFWPIMELLCGYPLETYAKRVGMIISHRLALWDVLTECARAGSADQRIRDEKANDVPALLATHPGIDHIIFNGAYAMRMYRKHMELPLADVTFATCPSTSAAHAIGVGKKAEAWLFTLRKALEML